FSGEARRYAASEPRPDAIGVAADPAATADDPPVAPEEDDVDAVAAQPRPLVEAFRRGPRQAHPRVERDDRALRRRAADGKVEQHGLAEPDVAEPDQPGRQAEVELAAARRSGDDRDREARLPHPTDEHARVDRVQASAPPPPAGRRQRDRQEPD